MGEVELTEIESRIESYPPQARHDILRLTREVRRLHATRPAKTAPRLDSPVYDPTTGLLNGGAYGVRFAMARARATRYRKIFAVMSIDLDFSNAALNPGELEQTLQIVAARLESCVRATDTLARVDESKFAIILEDLTQADQAERVKQNVQDALAESVRLREQEIVPPTHVELRFYPDVQSDTPPRLHS